MVSPRKERIDVENRFGSIAGIKNNLLPGNLVVKPSFQPLGDVQNTIRSARNLLQVLSEEASLGAKKDSKLEPSKCKTEPVTVVQEKEEPFDPVWDAPLTYRECCEDDYFDIIPPSLQLTDEVISRFVLNKPKLLSDVQVDKQYEDDDFIPTPEFTFFCHVIEENDDFFDDLPPEVPSFSDSDDCWSDEEI